MLRASLVGVVGAMFGCGLLARVDETAVVVTDDGGGDAASQQDAGDGSACAQCSASLAVVCGDGGESCPPALDAPGFFSWAQQRASQVGTRDPRCASMTTCPDYLMVIFPEGTDCSQSYLFDPNTKQLVSILHSCDSFILTTCLGSTVCLPSRCVPSEGIVPFNFTPPGCPALPVRALDAGAD
jgi:hypothetical protein